MFFRRKQQPVHVERPPVHLVLDGREITVVNKPKPIENPARTYAEGKDLFVLDATPRTVKRDRR